MAPTATRSIRPKKLQTQLILRFIHIYPLVRTKKKKKYLYSELFKTLMMNTIISKVGLILLATFVIGGCVKDDSTSEASAADGMQSKAKTYHIYYAAWEKWGHVDGNNDCVGWGLCRFEDCWFCCTENDLIVDCSSLEEIPNAGEALIDKETDLGVMTISLDSSNPEHVSAINNRSDLIITDDLNDGELTLLKGNYPYISGIGNDGGYEVNAQRIP